MIDSLRKIEQEYFTELSKQVFNKSELDYTILENQIPFLDQMANVKNSGLTVFDLCKKEHVYNSFNLTNLFGYDLNDIDTNYYNSKIHPSDFISLMNIGVYMLKKFNSFSEKEKKDYKLQNEYRILNSNNEYIRVIEQFQVLELDAKGNVWLALSTMDISPNQKKYDGIRSQLINVNTGEISVINLIDEKKMKLSHRENQILHFVNDGMLSKEISNELSISIHTVNTHRQNILKKLGANSSLEAIKFAKHLNLV